MHIFYSIYVGLCLLAPNMMVAQAAAMILEYEGASIGWRLAAWIGFLAISMLNFIRWPLFFLFSIFASNVVWWKCALLTILLAALYHFLNSIVTWGFKPRSPQMP